MAASIKRILPSLLLDSLVVVAFVVPEACAYLRWPLLALYAVLAWSVFRMLSTHRWIVTIVRDPATRLAHGLEHATIAVLAGDGLPAAHGFTHGRDRFMVALARRDGLQPAAVRDAAASAIRRIRAGERSLAYLPGCGTSDVVSAVSLWLVYVSSMLFTLLVGGSIAIFFALSVVALRFWLACDESLGLLAQRLFTVSTAFTSATVVDVREVTSLCGRMRPANETWFEVIVDVRRSDSSGKPAVFVVP